MKINLLISTFYIKLRIYLLSYILFIIKLMNGLYAMFDFKSLEF